MATESSQYGQEFVKNADGDSSVVNTTVVHPKDGEHSLDQSELNAAERGVTANAPPAGEGRERYSRRKTLFGYVKTKQFWIVLVFGQVLSLCIVGTNTTSQLLASHGTSIPAFQSFFNYVLLNIVWTGITIHKYSFKGWGKMVYTHGWKCKFLHLRHYQSWL